MALIDVKHRDTAAILCSLDSEPNSLKLTLEAGVKAGANLRGADLRYVTLQGADLTGADLTDADLTGTPHALLIPLPPSREEPPHA